MSREPGFGIVDEVSGLSYANATDRDELSWIAQPGATSYELARSTSRLFDSGCALIPAGGASTVSDPVVPAANVVHYYLLRAVDPNPEAGARHLHRQRGSGRAFEAATLHADLLMPLAATLMYPAAPKEGSPWAVSYTWS